MQNAEPKIHDCCVQKTTITFSTATRMARNWDTKTVTQITWTGGFSGHRSLRSTKQ